MTGWSDLELLELATVPRLPDGQGESEGEHRRNRLREIAAALGGAHTTLRSRGPASQFVSAWIRMPDDPRVHVLIGGSSRGSGTGTGSRSGVPFVTAPASRDGDSRLRSVLFPPGALAAPLAPDAFPAMIGHFPSWVGCEARADALWAPSDTSRQRPTVRRGSFDVQVAHLSAPFVWLVVAEPLDGVAVQAELEKLAVEILPLTRAEVGETKRVQLERQQARHRELSRVKDTGAWRIRVAVGAASDADAEMIAGTLSAATELDELPYVMAPAADATSFVNGVKRPGFIGSTDVVAALTRPPERELPGLTLVEPHTFDQTSELARMADINVGTIVNESGESIGSLTVSKDVLSRHTFVCGATGSGKSQTVRHLLTEATRIGLPWLVIEPAKAEYALMAARLEDLGAKVLVIRPGDPNTMPAGFNPLQPVKDFPLQTHVDLVRALFLAAFEAQEPFPQILATALTRSYEELGWDLALGTPLYDGAKPRYPTLGDLERVADAVVNEIGYGPEIRDNVRGFIKVRIGSLRLGTLGRFFEGGHNLDLKALRRRNVVMEIQDVGDDADKAFFIGAMLLQQTEHLRVLAKNARQGASLPLSHLTVLEEAHRLLRRPEPGTGGPARHAVEEFASMLAEVRAYGEGLIVVEQIPQKLTSDIIKNTALKIVHRLPAADDRESVGATMNIDERQSRQLVSLRPGQAAVFADGMDRAVLARMMNGTEIEKKDVTAAGVYQALISQRSSTCGIDCAERACTTGEMRHALQLLLRAPWLTLWSELVVVAHLSGCRTPRVAERLLQQLRAENSRILDCAISHAIDAAVNARRATIRRWKSSEDLAGHCVEVLRQIIVRDAAIETCPEDDDYVYVSTLDQWFAIRSYILETPFDAPLDPRTSEWERQTGRMIPGATRTEQLDVVDEYLKLAEADITGRELVTFGAVRPSALERAIGTETTDPRWVKQVQQAVTAFPNVRWIQSYLAPIPPDSEDAPRG